MAPFLGVDVDGVAVADNENGLLFTVAFEARDDVGALAGRVENEDLVLDAFAVEDGLQIVHDRFLTAARVGAIQLDESGEMPEGFGFDFRPVKRRGLGVDESGGA